MSFNIASILRLFTYYIHAHIKKCFIFFMEEHIIEKSDTLAVKRDHISFNTQKRHWPRKESRG